MHCYPAQIRQVRAGSTLKRVQPLVHSRYTSLSRLPDPLPSGSTGYAPALSPLLPALTHTSGIRLQSASPICYDRPAGRVSHPPPNTQRLVAHLHHVERIGDLGRVRQGDVVDPPVRA